MNIDQFLEQFSPHTQTVYRSALRKYCEVLHTTTDQYDHTKRNHTQDIQTFKKYLEKRPSKTMHTYLMGVKQFLEDNKIPLDDMFRKQRRREKKLKVVRALTQDYIPTQEELRQLLSHAKLKDRALILCLLSSGMRIGELLQLTTHDVHLDETPCRVEIQGDYTKNGVFRTTFISNEALETLREWLKVKDVFETTAGCRHYSHKKNGDSLFPFTYCSMIQSWNRLLTKSGLDMKDRRTGRYQLHPHCLRKVFRTQMPKAIGLDMTEEIMGHTGYLTESYRRPSVKELAAAYLVGMGVLSVFQIEPDLTEITEDVTRLRKDNEQLRTQMQLLMARLLTIEDKS